MTKLKIGVMSFAHVHATTYLSNLLSRADAEVLTSDPDGASATDSAPRGAEFAANLGARYVASYDELFDWGPDAVVICSENARHIEPIRRAAAAGVHILCEKPLATSVAEAEKIIAIAEAAQVMLMTAFPVRLIPAFEALVDAVRGGAVGDVLSIMGTNNGKIPIGMRDWFTDPQLAGGGALVDHVVHCADLLFALLGEEPETVHAVSNKILHADRGVEVETAGLVTLRYPSGVFATIDCSWSQPDNALDWGNVGLEVTGSRGTLTFEGVSRSVRGTDLNGAVSLPVGFDMDDALITRFLEAVRSGVGTEPSGSAGLRATRIAAAAQSSAADGFVVHVDG